MARKCPVCGSELVEKIPFSGDLIQRYSGQYVCTKCSYKTKTREELLEEALRKLEQEEPHGG